MRVDYISDVHLDFWLRVGNCIDDKFVTDFLNAKVGDMLIIAGDLGHYFDENKKFLLHLRKIYKNVLLVNGNHDMYLISTTQQREYGFNSMNRVLEIKKFCQDNDGIHYLDGDIVNINGFNFAGVGMSWDTSFFNKKHNNVVDIDKLMYLFKNTMNDSKLIFKIDPIEFFNNEHDKLKKFNEEDKIDVMITHYLPIIPDNMPDIYKNSDISTFYIFDGVNDIKRIRPKYWIFGHTHHIYEFEKHSVNFLCNPLGYPQENKYTQIKSFNL